MAELEEDLAWRAAAQARAQAAAAAREINYIQRRILQELGLTVVACLFFWPALFCNIIVATNSSPAPWEWLGAVVSPVLMIWLIVIVVRMALADRRRRADPNAYGDHGQYQA